MKLTGSVGYAIGILLQVSGGSEEGPMTAARIARGCRFPPRFLYRILRRLVDADLLAGTSGPGGGYRLARAPAEVTLLDIVAAVDTLPEASMLRPVRASHGAAIKEVNAISAATAERFARELKRKKLSELVELAAKPGAAKGKASHGTASSGKAGGKKPAAGPTKSATKSAAKSPLKSVAKSAKGKKSRSKRS